MKFTDSEISNLVAGIAAQNDELARLREFARFAIISHDDDLGTYSMAIKLKLLVPTECGLAFELAESLAEYLNNKGE